MCVNIRYIQKLERPPKDLSEAIFSPILRVLGFLTRNQVSRGRRDHGFRLRAIAGDSLTCLLSKPSQLFTISSALAFFNFGPKEATALCTSGWRNWICRRNGRLENFIFFCRRSRTSVGEAPSRQAAPLSKLISPLLSPIPPLCPSVDWVTRPLFSSRSPSHNPSLSLQGTLFLRGTDWIPFSHPSFCLWPNPCPLIISVSKGACHRGNFP